MAAKMYTALTALSGIAIQQATSSPITSRNIGSKPCTSFTIPMPITVHQHEYDLVQVDNNIDAASFEVDISTWNSPQYPERISKNITISKTYDIFATLCVPPNGSKKNLLQIATHGGGFDSRYWDPEVEPEKYSYVHATLEKGYSILTYDRLTAGKSAHPDAYTEGQLNADIGILRGITEIVRSGKLASYASNTIDFDKIIHVAHSFGSFITYSLTSMYPELSDAAVLTGYLPSNESGSIPFSAGDVQYAPEVDPKLFSDSKSGYIVTGSKNALQVQFFSSRANKTAGVGGFDPKLLDLAWETRQPITVSDIESAQDILINNPIAAEFTGPVQFLSGAYDWLQCLGYCEGTIDLETLKMKYPKAKDVEFFLQPGTGHGLPFHYGAKAGFQKTFDFLERNGF